MGCRQVVAAIQGQSCPTIACLGLAYKPDIDDLRDSAAIEVVKQLRARTDAKIVVVEPNVRELPAQLAAYDVELVGLDAALAMASTAVLLVSHCEFLALDLATFADVGVVDTVGILDYLERSHA